MPKVIVAYVPRSIFFLRHLTRPGCWLLLSCGSMDERCRISDAAVSATHCALLCQLLRRARLAARQ